MSLLDFLLFGESEKEEISDDLNDLELEDWQKEEIKNGNYDSWNFEEEELEEDDYYYEDDE